MKRLFRVLTLLALAAGVACVTINIYFPAEEVRNAADKIVNEVWGDRAAPPAPKTPIDNKGSYLRQWLGPATAHAAQDIEVSTPEIRAIRESLKQRSAQLFPYLDSGHVGIARDGLLKLRTAEGLDLKSRGETTRLVTAENADRQRLYQEIARANGFPDQVAEVQEVFADSWRAKAAAGWYLEQPDGTWKKK
jgi:uncharacterized protein YdbL (DUF1318 family)